MTSFNFLFKPAKFLTGLCCILVFNLSGPCLSATTLWQQTQESENFVSQRPLQTGQDQGAVQPSLATDPATDTSVSRVPEWAKDAIFYQIFPERFRNGDPSNDPTRESLEFPEFMPDSWRITPWTQQWYARCPWEVEKGDNFYDNGVFHRRYGGDLQGVIDKLDYLADLGINTIYFNPVFYARSMHKYDGNSFHHVEPHFGPDPVGDLEIIRSETEDPATWQWTAADKLFLELIKQAHQRNIRVIIDGVFNHTGRDFFAFADIVKNQQNSKYVDWYNIRSFNNPDTPENEFAYDGWWGVETLPEFGYNEDKSDLHPGPKAYIFNATRRWMDPNGDGDPSDGIDGWRLDVANEVPNQFWRDWHQMVREINPQAFTIAEIWDEASDYLEDCGFGSTMNYHGFAFPVKGFIIDGRMKASEFAESLVQRMNAHAEDVRFGLQNLIDSHDTDRVASMIVNADQGHEYLRADRFDYDMGERVSPRHFKEYDVSAPNERHRQIQRMLALFQISSVGPPMIYYGTEAGMDGADDPCDRMPMVWDDLEYEDRTLGPFGPLEESFPISFDHQLFEYYKRLFKVRAETEPLRRGTFEVLWIDDDRQLIAFGRQSRVQPNQFVIGIVNRGDQPVVLQRRQLAPFTSARTDWQLLISSSEDEQDQTRRRPDPRRITVPALTAQLWQVANPK